MEVNASVSPVEMLQSFRGRLEDSGLIPDGARVLVGYSGGADSTALLHMLKSCGVDVIAGHLHHGMRPEAEDELSRCQAFAEKLDVPFLCGRADVPRMAVELRIGVEEAGREARYAFFSQAKFSMDCTLIATAHTKSDQIETILLNITRGCGLRGLTGIPERRDDIIRPLLAFSRSETKGYCEALGLWTHDDPANTDLSFARARIRANVVPELRLVNQGIDAAVLRLAAIADEEDRFLDGMAAAALEQTDIPLNGELRFLTEDIEIRFDRHRLAHLPGVLANRAVRLACEALGSPLTREQTLIAVAGLVSDEVGAVTSEGGSVVVEWNGAAVDVRRIVPRQQFRSPLTVPGETISDEFGWQLTAEECYSRESETRRSALEALVDGTRIKGPLYFRSFEAGDQMQPFGFMGRRKLADLLSEAKLTQAARDRLPIVCDMIGPVWAPGVCLSERARSDALSERVIRLSFSMIKLQGWHNIRNAKT